MTTFGFQIPGFRHAGTADAEMFDITVEHAVAAERGGFESVWVMDHFWQLPPLGGPDEPILEAYTLLGALAAATDWVKLGTLVTGVTYRNPALVAKMVTTLDVISHGRAILGREQIRVVDDLPRERRKIRRGKRRAAREHDRGQRKKRCRNSRHQSPCRCCTHLFVPKSTLGVFCSSAGMSNVAISCAEG